MAKVRTFSEIVEHLWALGKGAIEERDRVLKIVESTIGDWCYASEVAEDVLCVLVNLGNEIADDGGIWATRVMDVIEHRLDEYEQEQANKGANAHDDD